LCEDYQAKRKQRNDEKRIGDCLCDFHLIGPIVSALVFTAGAGRFLQVAIQAVDFRGK
jgi:hypothetical protein